jgi:hypothetical protein
MIHYTINHFVTTDETTATGGTMDTSTVHGDDAVAVWLVSDYATDAPDLTIEQPPEGFTWTVGMDGYTEHPPELDPEDHLDTIQTFTTDAELASLKEDYLAGEIMRVSPWETPLTDGHTQS